ncbi:HNH endonuclease [Chromobacterium haemolyticum]|uniref:HNH endonuclease n=1 Tax=Chromobacterium haemolyticum TaxID=394935 RepID=UPI002448CBBF|nr:HNH endonuclease signature motif containing protein [Chromobacterium haemolyticum]MDH0342015.1 HNH endonuclease [Chromobacterium haemolyticum]
MKLTIELVPATCWYSNVRSNVFPATWDRLQAMVFKAAGYRCEECGGRGDTHPVECHEVWSYDDHKLIQRLERLISLCPKCHQVKHIGLAVKTGKASAVIAWLASVNDIPPEKALQYAQHAFKIHQIRSRFQWSLDLQVLTNLYGVKLDRYGIEQGLNVRP